MGKRFNLLVVFAFFVSIIHGQTITRGPYIQMLSDDRAVVRYRTSTPVPTEVSAGTSLGVYTEFYSSATNTTEHEAIFTGLNADTRYFYAINQNASPLLTPSSDRYFQTAPPTGSHSLIRAWILGDCGTGNANARSVRNAYYNYLGNQHNDLILMLGDNAYNNGTDAEYQGAVFQNMYEDLLAQSPLFPTLGNHEFYNGATSSATGIGPYFNIFSLPTNAELGGLASGTEAYYSYDYGNIHFISLDSHDSDRSPSGPMLTWLDNDLALTQQEWIVVYFHHPPYSKGSHDSDDVSDSGGRLEDMRENVLPILENYGVDLVLSGHSHSYERSYLLDGHYGLSSTLTSAMILDNGDGQENGDGAYQKNYLNAASSAGAIYITSGSAGKISGGPLNHPVMHASFNTLGSCILEVDGGRLDLKFLNNSGVIADSFTINKQIFVGSPPTVSISNPLDGAFIPLPTTITLSSISNDADGNVQSVEYFVNGISAGSSTVSPFDLSYVIPASGTFDLYAIATDNDGNAVTSNVISFNVGASTASLTVAVSNSNDDAEEGVSGTIKLTSSDLELINEANSADQLVGIRFRNISVPAGAKIDSAYIQFTVDELNNANPVDISIRGEQHFNSATFANVLGNLSNRDFTEASVVWSPINWTIVGQSAADQRTPNLASIMQEIVDLPGWQANNAASFFLSGWGRRIAESYDGTAAPELSVYYTISPPPLNTAPEISISGIPEGATQINFDPITFVAKTKDSTDYVNRVEFYLNGVLQVNDNTFPFSHDITPTSNGAFQLVAVAIDQGGLSTADTLNYTIDNTIVPTTRTGTIATSIADAEENKSGLVLLNGNRLDLVRNASYTTGNQVIGLHYSNLDIPQGSIIYEAYLQFVSAAGNQNYHIIDLEISGHASENAPIFSNVNSNLSSRARTSATVSWAPPVWTATNQVLPAQRTPDISSILQEIVDRPGWQSNNGLALLIEGEGGRAAHAYDSNPARAPQLFISYLAPPQPVQVERGPYLQMGSDTSMVVRLRTQTPRQLELIYGTNLNNLNQSVGSGSSTTEHEFFIGGLNPNTTYYYAFAEGVDTFLTPNNNLYWRTAPSPGTQQAIKAWILGDPGTANANARAVRDAYYSRMNGQHTDLMIMLGDNAYNNGTDAQYQAAVFENMYEALLQKTVLYPAPGNHEFYNGGTSSATETGPYYDIFSLPKNAEAGGLASGTEAYYSYDFGNVHFISLDSHDSDRSTSGSMLTWLTNDLAATDQEWIVVYFHHPPYTKGSHDSDNVNDSGGRLRDIRENVLPILENYGVDLVLSGHSHSYERSFLLNGHYDISSTLTPAMILDNGNGQVLGDGAYEKDYLNNASTEGTVYITAGSSGKISGGALNHPAMYASLNTLGSCLLEVDGDQLELKFLTSTGIVADSFLIQKTIIIGDPPVVNMTAPLNASSFAGPQTITLEANATDSDGTVSSVEFVVNNTAVGTVNAAPWQLNFAANIVGNYEVYAIATDNDGNVVNSDTIQFSITPSLIPPTVSISAPVDGTIYPAPQAITLAANAADADGTVTSVEFFINGLSIGTVNAAPWQLAYVIPASGTYDLYAIAADDDANTTTSATIQFSAKTPPTVSISAPLDGTIYPAPQAITLAANAADADGSITGVEFFVNGLSIGTVNAAPWQLAYVIPASGTYDLYAIAADDDANTTTSATIQFSAKTPPTVSISTPVDGTIYPAPQAITLAANAADADGSITGVEFFVNGISVGTVNTAPWQLAYVIPASGTYDVYAVATDDDGNNTTSATIQFSAKTPPTVSISAPLDGTIYPAPQAITLEANAADADGSITAVEFFVNGLSIGTVNAAPWQLAYVIPASGTYDVYAVATDDDANTTTSATIQFTAKTPPTVSISAPLDGTVYPAPQAITLEANATDADGSITGVEFFVNGLSVGTVNAAPWQLPYTIPASGVFNVYAIATDDDANTTTSATIQFTVNVPLLSPTVSISTPVDGTIYPAPQAITLAANAADADGNITAVEFFVNGLSLGTINAAPWQMAYVIPASGTYDLYAIAADDDANTTTSATIQFTAKTPPTVNISAPLDGTVYPAPQAITLEANAADADGSITGVEFFVNGLSVGTVNAAPWQLPYTIPASGVFNVYAIATDDDANTTTSATIQFTAKTPPTVNISAPLDGTIYPAPQAITLTANAADADGSITGVEFFVNGLSIGTVNAAPWQLAYVIPASGVFNVYAIATDDDANTTTSATIQFTAKTPPTVSISAPLDGTVYPAPQAITLEANAADADGSITAVEFFVNGLSLGTVNAAPWQMAYVTPASGTYDVYAVATDDDGNNTTSATIQFSAKTPPTVSISAPLDGTVYPAPQAITLEANAADADGSITGVEFFVNGISVGTVNTAPWQLPYIIPASGVFNVYAIATDDDANNTTSATIQFSAKTPPTVSISAPLDGTVYPAPQAITLAANATDADGSITGVEFFVNGLSIGTVNAAPWQMAYVIPASGTYDLYAIATDDDANSTTSATIQFTAKTPPTVSISAPLDGTVYPAPQAITLEANAADADGSITTVEFFVNGLSIGTVNATPWQMAYVIPASGTYDLYAIATDDDANSTTSATIQFSAKTPPTVSISAPLDGTIYPAPQAITLAANAADADGSITGVEFFVNGISVGTVNTAPWQLAFTIPASGVFNVYAIATDDDANTTTSATIQFTAKTPPTVNISAPLDGTIYPAPQAITLAANAADPDGSITGVEFFVNGLSVGTVNTAPWQLAYVIPASGTYDVYAVTTDDDGNNTTSATIQFSAKTPPTVSISAPLDGTVYPAPQAITLEANAADADGSITAVEFFVNGLSIGTVNAAPWQLAYVIPASGTYDVYAVATDDDGNNTTSATIQFSVPITTPIVSIISPLDGTVFNSPQIVNIQASAVDPNGFITSVQFYVNGISVGSSFFSPWQIGLNATYGTYDVYAIATDNQSNSTISDTIQFSISAIPVNMVEIQVDMNGDDGVEMKDGQIELDNDWIEMAEKGPQDFVLAAYRFTDIPLGPNIQVDSAFLIFQSRGSDDRDPVDLLIYGEDNFNPTPFTNTVGDLSDRPRTQSMISWTPAPWPSAAVEHRSADIAPLVQELIDIPGWANGNAMSFFIAGEGKRSAYAHDNDSTKAAKLKIFYTDLNPTANTAPSIAFTDYDSSLQRIDLTVIPLAVNVQDSTGEISQVVFTINGVTFATDTQYPFETSFIPGANGSYEVIATVSDDGGLSAADTLQIEVDNTLLVQTNNGQISQSNADGEEAELGFVEITDQSIQLVKEKNAGEQYVILHFSGLQIPAGAHIYEAYIQFATQNVNLNYHPIDINIRGEYEPNSNLLQNTNGNISSRSFTQASINWRPRIWTVPDESGPRQRTPDLTDLVREMVNHPNWSDNSPLSFIMSGMGGRAAHSFDSDPNQAAELVIKYKPELPLARGPYLQSGSDTSIVVRFQTQGAKMTELRYGTSLANLNQNIISSTAAVDHRFPIEGLTPNTRYYYEVRVGGQAVAPASNLQYWETAPTSTTIDTVRAWVLGDAGTGNGDARAVRDAYYDYLGDKHTDMILMLGDNAFPNGTQDDYQAAIFENMYEELLARTVLWTSPGERDFANGFTDSNTELGPYYDIFDLPRNGEAGGMASGTEAYYSYNYSNVHFVSLDVFGSDLSPAGGMQSWLSADLATNNQDWTVVFLHHSPYSKGTFDSDTTSIMAAVRQNILPILDTYKVDLVLGAHSQGYERSYLSQGHYGSSQTLTDSMILSERSGNPAIDGPYAKSPNNGLGTVYVVSGSAGTTSPANYGHPIMYQGDSKMGASVLEVFDRTLDFKFLDSTGNIFDHFQIIKGEAPAVSLLTPSDGAVIPAPQNVSITANATDSDGNVLSVDFMVNGALVGTDLTAPWTQAWTPPANGIYEIVAVATDDDGIVSYSEPISLFVGNSFSICIPISSGGNDVEENAAGEMDLRNGALRMINNNGSQQIGLRFERPNILPGAVINDAYIQFTADTVHTASTLLFFEIEEAFPSAPFGNQANEVSGRTYQGGIVSWNVPTWANAGDATIDQQSPDLANQIEQYVSHPSYQLNQPITYRVSGSGLRRARAYDQKSGDQAVLCVNFELPETCHPIADAAAITVWHKADEGIYENNGSNAAETGDGVARWQNFALAGGDAQQLIAGKRPIYTEPTATGVFNGSGGISFGSNRSFELPDNWQENTYRVMIVQRSAPAVSKQAILASASGPNKPYIQIYKEGQSYYYFMGTDTQNETLLIGSDVGTGSEYHVIDVFNVNDQLQATLDANPHNSVNLTADPLSSTFLEQITLGEDPNDDLADFQGEIAEVLVFERDLTGVEFGQIMTYLSVKYGIKIPAAAHNYYTDGTYDNRLFGIGQNLADLCLQKTNSRSVMPDNRVRFSEPSELDEGEFLISGDNGNPFTPFSTQVPLGFAGRLNRIYKVAETGDVGTISLEFDMDGLGVNLGQPGRFFLLKDQDGDFSDAQIANSNIATISGTNLRFTEVDFADGDLYTIAYGEGIQISPKVMLSGPYDLFSGFMNDGLRSNGYLPLREPYEAMASYTHIGYGGGETVDPSVFTLAGNNAIVDWVFIELRDVHDSTQVLATRSALLQRDGDVVDIDGSSAVFFPAVAAGDYFVAIRHRNHLPVMTASSVALSATSISLDFSDPSSPTYGENAQKSLSATTMGLWSGDVNQDHQLVFQGVGNDVQSIFLKVLTDPANTSFARNYVVNGYELTDVNMDGQSIFQGGGSDVTGIFVNILSFPANTGFNRNYVISGQLP